MMYDFLCNNRVLINIGLLALVCRCNYEPVLEELQDTADKSEISKQKSQLKIPEIQTEKVTSESLKDKSIINKQSEENNYKSALQTYSFVGEQLKEYTTVYEKLDPGIQSCINVLIGTKIDQISGNYYGLLDIVKVIYNIPSITDDQAIRIARQIRVSGICAIFSDSYIVLSSRGKNEKDDNICNMELKKFPKETVTQGLLAPKRYTYILVYDCGPAYDNKDLSLKSSVMNLYMIYNIESENKFTLLKVLADGSYDKNPRILTI